MSTPYDPPGSDKEPGGSPDQGPGQGYEQGQGYGQGYGPGYGPPYGQGYLQAFGPLSGGPPVQQTNGVAVASLVTGIMSVTLGWCCVIFALAGPIAVVLGKQGQRRADESGGQVGGRAMATAGFVLGIIGTVVLVLGVGWIIYLVASGRGFTPQFNPSTNGLSS